MLRLVCDMAHYLVTYTPVDSSDIKLGIYDIMYVN